MITIIFIYHYVFEKVKGNGIGYIQEEADLGATLNTMYLNLLVLLYEFPNLSKGRIPKAFRAIWQVLGWSFLTELVRFLKFGVLRNVTIVFIVI